MYVSLITHDTTIAGRCFSPSSVTLYIGSSAFLMFQLNLTLSIEIYFRVRSHFFNIPRTEFVEDASVGAIIKNIPECPGHYA